MKRQKLKKSNNKNKFKKNSAPHIKNQPKVNMRGGYRL